MLGRGYVASVGLPQEDLPGMPLLSHLRRLQGQPLIHHPVLLLLPSRLMLVQQECAVHAGCVQEPHLLPQHVEDRAKLQPLEADIVPIYR